MKLIKPILTAVFCALLIAFNAWLAVLSWRDDAYLNWSQQLRVATGLNIGAHVAMAVFALLALIVVKALWCVIIGAVMKAGVAAWLIAHLGGATYTNNAPFLIVFWLAVAAASYLMIRWNYPPVDTTEDHPEREFA